MQIFDTHCHIAGDAFESDLPQVISRMREECVCRANVIADPCDEEPNQEKVFSIIDEYDFLVGSIGCHPHNAIRYDSAAEKTILTCLKHPRCVLLGEIGLDYHYDLSPRDVQRRVFDRQLDLAYERNIPVQLHIREAHADCMDMLRSRAAEGRMPAGIMHCYTSGWEDAKVYLDLGMYISFSGALTFKNAPALQDACIRMPADRILVETDCPYMAPVPLRGKRCEPAFVTHTLAKAAALRNAAPDPFAAQVYENSLRALRLQDVTE